MPYITEFNRLWELFDAESEPRANAVTVDKLLGKGSKYYVEGKERK